MERLYTIEIKLKEMKLWEEFYTMDLITIFPGENEDEEPCICNVIGKNVDYYAIGTFIGINSIHNLFQMANSHDMPDEQLIRYQYNTMCYFGDIYYDI